MNRINSCFWIFILCQKLHLSKHISFFPCFFTGRLGMYSRHSFAVVSHICSISFKFTKKCVIYAGNVGAPWYPLVEWASKRPNHARFSRLYFPKGQSQEYKVCYQLFHFHWSWWNYWKSTRLSKEHAKAYNATTKAHFWIGWWVWEFWFRIFRIWIIINQFWRQW